MQTIFSGPTAYAFLIDRFDGSRLPSAEILKNILQTAAHISSSWADRVASLFMSTAAELNLIDAAGFLRYGAEVHSSGSNNSAATINPAGGADEEVDHESDKENVPAPLLKPPFYVGKIGDRPDGNQRDGAMDAVVRSSTGRWHHNEGGGWVKLELSNPLPWPLWERLRKYVEMLEPEKPETGGANDKK